jgi:hypothetical protein
MRTLILAIFLATTSLAAPPTVQQQQKTYEKELQKWAKAFYLDVSGVDFKVVSAGDMLVREVQMGGQPEMLYGLSGRMPVDSEGRLLLPPANASPESTAAIAHASGVKMQPFIWVLREQDYPWYSNARKIRIDQRNSTVHELIHVMSHTLNQEEFTRALANVLVKGPKE